MPDRTQTDYAALANEISGWLRHQMEQAGASRLILGLSGGIDSAVVCALCARAAGPAAVIAAILPVYSRPEDRGDAESVARTFDVHPYVIDLAPAFDALIAAIPANDETGIDDSIGQEQRRRLAAANTKPRLRMTALYYLANRANGLVVGTGNKSELSIGYFTKYGDGGVDLLPLGDLDKTTVRALARELGVPDSVIAKPPSAGLWDGQTDEIELGLTYEELDRALAELSTQTGATNGSPTRDRVTVLVAASNHKRHPIPVFECD